MTFEGKFNKILYEDINDLRTLFKKGGYDKRHMNAKTGSKRIHQNFIPVVHRADGASNNKIEHLRKTASGTVGVDMNDLIHIINTYIKQGDQEPCNAHNVHAMADKYLKPSKNLGTTGIMVIHNPATNGFSLKK
jgi:hypothetical protein